MSRSSPVKGMADIDRFLSAFPKNLQRNAYNAGLRAAAKVVRDEARLRAPKDTGLTAKSISSGSPRKNQDGTISIRVRADPKKKNSFVAYFNEFGVSPHFVQSGDSGISARLLTRAAKRGDVTGDADRDVLKIGDQFVSGDVFHPGVAPQPFLRPALEVKMNEAILAFRGQIVAYIEGKTGFNAVAAFDEAA